MKHSLILTAMGAVALSLVAFLAVPASAMPVGSLVAPSVSDQANILNVASTGWAARAQGKSHIYRRHRHHY
jgi:hypothetical protein